MGKKFTAVFDVKDAEAFRFLCVQITGAMAGGNLMHGAKVTGAGWCDAMTESDNMREFLDSNGYDAEEIAGGFQ